MIRVTGLKNNEFVINAEHIEKIEEILGSTTITLTNGNKYIVVETADEIISKVSDYKRHIFGFGIKE